jgi:Xaa-Pro aminopeptidase
MNIKKNQMAQNIARQAMSDLHHFIKVGMSEKEIEFEAVARLEAGGSSGWWYYGLGAFILLGKRSILSMSGSEYAASEENRVAENDVITIDLAPTVDTHWGDYARTIFVEDGVVAEEDNPQKPQHRCGLDAELRIHQKLYEIFTPEMQYEELYERLNAEIIALGFENLDFHGNLGHSVEIDKDDRVYLEKGSHQTFKQVNKPFTLEPHIRVPGSTIGFKRENIYYFREDGSLHVL